MKFVGQVGLVFPGGDNFVRSVPETPVFKTVPGKCPVVDGKFVWCVLEVEAPDFVKTVPGKYPAAALLRPTSWGLCLPR